VIATVGLAILGLNGLSIGFGEAITLASALIYAVHIVGLSAWSQAREALGLATVQLMVTALVSLGAALVVEGGVSLPTTGFDWLAILYMAVVSGAVAMIVQSWAQAHLAPSRAAITMATEPAWAALFSIMFLAEPMTWRMAVGGGLLAGPVRGRRLKHAKLVAVRVGHDVPAPSVFADRLLSEHPGAKADEPAGLRLKFAGAQIEMNPVLALAWPPEPAAGGSPRPDHGRAGGSDSGQWPHRPGHSPARRSRTRLSDRAGRSRSRPPARFAAFLVIAFRSTPCRSFIRWY